MKRKSESQDSLFTKKNKLNLYEAVKQNQESLVAEYINERVSPNFAKTITIQNNFTISEHILTIAIQNKNYNIIKMLMDAGADPNYKDLAGGAISYAANSEVPVQILKLLLNYDSVKEKLNCWSSIYNPLIKAVTSGCVEKVKLLVEAGANYSNKMGLVHTAARLGHNDVLNYLVSEKDLDINYIHNKKSVLFEAFTNRHYDTTTLCIDKGANVNAQVHKQTFLEEILSSIVSEQDINLLKIVLKAGGNPCKLNQEQYECLNKLSDEEIMAIISYNKAYYDRNSDILKICDSNIATAILQRESALRFKDFNSRKEYDIHLNRLNCLKQVIYNEPSCSVMSLKDQTLWYIHDNFNPQSIPSGELPNTLKLTLDNDFQYNIIGVT